MGGDEFGPARCRSCGTRIVWAVTATGKPIPVDAILAENGNIRLVHRPNRAPFAEVVPAGEGQHVSHFVTCRDAGGWRRKK